MTAQAITMMPIPRGWAVTLTDGRQIARFSGPCAKWRALRYLERYSKEVRRSRRTVG